MVPGAGASRGASTSVGRLCQLPLNADFFTQLQRIANPKHQKKVVSIVGDMVGLFGPSFSLTMEEYFTQLESMALMARIATSNDRNFTPGEIRQKRDSWLLPQRCSRSRLTCQRRPAQSATTMPASSIGWRLRTRSSASTTIASRSCSPTPRRSQVVRPVCS